MLVLYHVGGGTYSKVTLGCNVYGKGGDEGMVGVFLRYYNISPIHVVFHQKEMN